MAFVASFLIFAVSPIKATAVDLSGALAIDADALERLEGATARYRALAARGGWPAFSSGPTLRPGESDPRVPTLRRLLSATGDLARQESGAANAYTPELADAMRSFQRRHGLMPDAAVGRRTSAALAVAAADRARALSLNFVRLRELSRRVPSRAVVVNIPAFSLSLLSNGRPQWRTRVIVGRPSWPTPTFTSTVTRVELNPYWNVPASIARRELAPIIAADPSYLARNDMKVLPRAANEPAIDPVSVDWRRFGTSGYRLRQDPGPDNPLGQVKFQIPNSFDVYLHDTPGRRSFEREMRALSHGCIRVENAMELAARLLAAEPSWSADRLAAEAATGRNTLIPLTQPIPVVIVYITAWVDPLGTVQFRPDIYDEDVRNAVLAAGPGGCGTSPLT